MTQAQAPPPPPPPSSSQDGPRNRGPWIVVGILAIVVLLAVAVAAIAAVTRETATEQRSFSSDDVGEIEVRGTAGEMDVLVEDRDDIAVTTRLTSRLWERASSDMHLADGTLAVESDCRRTVFFTGCTVEHIILLPADAVARVQLAATAGAIEVEGFAGDLEVTTTAGRIELLAFSGRTARLKTTAGEISVQAEVAPELLEVETTAGEVDIVVPDEAYRVVAETTVGDQDVNVRQDPDADRRISVSTTAGSITIDHP